MLTVLALSIVIYHLNKDGGEAVGCSADGNHWLFADCSARFFVQFLHVFTTMQCAAMARVIFIKSIKKFANSSSFERLKTRRYGQGGQGGEGIDDY